MHPESVNAQSLPSRSLKLLPILGVPSLVSRPADAIDRRGLKGVSSAARRGLRGPPLWCICRRRSVAGCDAGTPELTELVDESAVGDFLTIWSCSAGRRLETAGTSSSFIRSVALRSEPEGWWGVWAGPEERGRKAGESSSSSPSSRNPGLYVENLPNGLNRSPRRLSTRSSSSDSDSDELDVRSSSSRVGDFGIGRSRRLAEGRGA